MRTSLLRNILCCVMIVVVPASLLAADTKSAMLYTRGKVAVNGNAVPTSIAIFPGDEVQTQLDSVANINLDGSTINILADSFVKFEGTALTIHHGSVSIASSKGMVVKAGCLEISPASDRWTEYQVGYSAGQVQISARQGDVNVKEGGVSTPVLERQQTTRHECAETVKRRPGGAAVPAAEGGILNSTAAIVSGAAVVGGIITWALLQGDEPASPSKP